MFSFLPSVGDIFKPVRQIGGGIGKSISDVFKPVRDIGKGIYVGVDKIFKGIGTTIDNMVQDPAKEIERINKVTKNIASGVGGIITGVVGKGGISTAAEHLVDATIGKAGGHVVGVVDGIGRNPLVAGSLLAGSGGFLALGVGAAAIALMVALK